MLGCPKSTRLSGILVWCLSYMITPLTSDLSMLVGIYGILVCCLSHMIPPLNSNLSMSVADDTGRRWALVAVWPRGASRTIPLAGSRWTMMTSEKHCGCMGGAALLRSAL